MVVEGIFEFFRESLDLETFVEKLLVQGEGLLLELVDLRGLGFHDLEFAGQVTDLELEKADILQSFTVLDLSFGQS